MLPDLSISSIESMAAGGLAHLVCVGVGRRVGEGVGRAHQPLAGSGMRHRGLASRQAGLGTHVGTGAGAIVIIAGSVPERTFSSEVEFGPMART